MSYKEGFENHAAENTDLARNILIAFKELMMNRLNNNDNKLAFVDDIIAQIEECHDDYEEPEMIEEENTDIDDVSDYQGEGYNGAIK